MAPGEESRAELLEPFPGLFLLRCTFEQKELAKDAGFRWHRGGRCRINSCPACAQGLGNGWLSYDILAALELVEYAGAELAADLEARGGPERAARRAELAEQAEREAERLAAECESLRMSLAEDADIDVPAPEGLDYLPYQRAGIAYAQSRPHTLLADEMGLGKTIQALGVINADPSLHRVLIVCPASLKLNWLRECERWLVRDMRCGVTLKRWPEGADVVITNYEVLGKWRKELKGHWDLLIADECHYVKNRHAKRSKRLFALDAGRMLMLTGTPVLNRPMEIQTVAAALAPSAFGDFWDFAKRYCEPKKGPYGWDFSGASNLEELHRRLRGTILVRRTKADVLKDLPPKRRQVIELSAEGMGNLVKAESAAWKEHDARLAELRRRTKTDAGSGATEAELRALREGVNAAFGELAKLRQETALAKVPLVVQHVTEALEASPKVVLFAHHRAVVEELALAFGEGAVKLMGGQSLAERQAAVDRFQQDPECLVFVGSITAAGFGLTLTAASHVVFAELDWVPAYLSQAEDRTHRIGQEDSVLVQHLVLEDSLDARMVRTLIKKQRVIDGVVDGIQHPAQRTELFPGDFADALIAAAEAAAAEAAAGEGAPKPSKSQPRRRRRS